MGVCWWQLEMLIFILFINLLLSNYFEPHWLFMVVFGHFWLFLSAFGCFWRIFEMMISTLAVYGQVWPFLAVFICFWLFLADF